MDEAPYQDLTPVRVSFLICSTGRTGSSLLSSTLVSLGCCGHPIEYFHHRRLKENGIIDNPSQLKEYVANVLRDGTTANGIFGTKIHWEQFSTLIAVAKRLDEFEACTDTEIINSLLPNPRFIFIWRRDTTLQAISREVATQTNVWGVKRHQEFPQDTPRLRFRPLEIYRHKLHIEQANTAWQKFFSRNQISVKEIVYEDFITSFEATIRSVTDYVGVDPTEMPAEIHMARKRQSNQTNARWRRNYSRVPEALWSSMYKLSQLV